MAAHPGYAGIHPLPHALDSFAARVLLIRAAERSLDLQYYTWQKDMTGTLLFEELHEAAARGVRVRLLLDDNNTSGLDSTFATLDAHPNIEVRLFNPFAIRGLRVFKYIFDFSRANRRMHNKSFTADNQVTIVGGRNIGDQYFGAGGGVLFADLDIMAVGPVVDAVSKSFDRYWASESSYPVANLIPRADSDTIAEVTAAVSRVKRDPATTVYTEAIRNSPFIRDLSSNQLDLEWATTRVISDDPAKGLGQAAPEDLMIHTLKEIIGEPASEVDLVSPYFVPTAAGTASFTALAERGVQVQVLTNSLEATDVALVHAGYAKWRKRLLEAGIKLYESRHLAPRVRRSGSGFGSGPDSDGFGSKGSSDTSLHAKTFSVDESRVFVGSFNFDPRSRELNTEMCFVIDSPVLAGHIADAFQHTIPDNAYELGLSNKGELYWIERVQGKEVRHDVEPGTNFLQRAALRMMSLLPIDWLL
ncbi:MAG TPA: phospholipase D family protein [Nitrosospira sp.]|nr:phospholipase D family protein [Nitrosospira sp.]